MARSPTDKHVSENQIAREQPPRTVMAQINAAEDKEVESSNPPTLTHDSQAAEASEQVDVAGILGLTNCHHANCLEKFLTAAPDYREPCICLEIIVDAWRTGQTLGDFLAAKAHA